MKIIASLLIFAGTLGYGICCIKENGFRISQMEKQRRIIMMMQGEIKHFHRNFPEVCVVVGEKSEEPYRTFLKNVSQKMNAWQGQSLTIIWKYELKNSFPERYASSYMSIFANLPERIKDFDSEMQEQSLNFAKETMEEQLDGMKRVYIQNRKMILWLSGIVGLVCIILLV